MTDKMISFLKHVNIDNIDDFDIDFEMVGRNRLVNGSSSLFRKLNKR